MSIKLYNETSFKISKQVINSYSTSFGMAVRVFNPSIRDSISSIYGFVRLADEIVDSFFGLNRLELINELRVQTYKAIQDGISINPVLNSFQCIVTKYNIPSEYIESFLDSMEMDMTNSSYKRKYYDKYIYGSAEVVGLMCLKVFCHNEDKLFESLRTSAMALGSAFQKVNFLRDIKSDLNERGRIYFPDADDESMICNKNKELLEKEIEGEFEIAFAGIKRLPANSALAVYSAYLYYLILFKKIKKMKVNDLLEKRIRISNLSKLALLFKSFFRVKFTKAFE